MIQSNKSVLIDAINQVSGIPYIKAHRKQEVDNSVFFDIEFFILHEEIREETVPVFIKTVNEPVMKEVDGVLIDTGETTPIQQFAFVKKKIKYSQLRLFHASRARYSLERFYHTFKDLDPDNYDITLLQEIDRLNAIDWTGKELSRIAFFGLTSKDFTILSDQEIIELTRPTIIEE